MVACEPCDNLRTIGWWGQAGTHCRDCHRSWTSLTEAHCTKCHLHFGSPSTADLHDSTGVCFSPDQTVRKDGTPLLALRDRKDGPVWVAWSEDRSFIEALRGVS